VIGPVKPKEAHPPRRNSPSVLSVSGAVNVGLRAVVEAGVVLGLGYWGFQTGSSAVSKSALAIGVPTVAFGIWGVVDFHQAGRWAEPLRLIQEFAISGLAALAVFSAGQPALGLVLGVATVVHHALVYLLGDRLLKGAAAGQHASWR
jgi:Protein of unknown function (DUF2568)